MARELHTITFSPEEVAPNFKEAARYLGYGKHEIDPETEKLLDSCREQLWPLLQPKCVYAPDRILDRDPEGGVMHLAEFGEIRSAGLTKHLAGCDRVLFMAATLGAGTDQLIRRYQKVQPSRSAVLSALGSAAIETVCDLAEDKITDRVCHTARFSPGYGDWPLATQTSFLEFLDMGRKLGICLSESCLMTPTKSVTAVIGLSNAPTAHLSGKKGCETCNNTTCLYRQV